jgi:hypothetical protein
MVGRSSTGRLQVASASRATLDANCATIAPEALTEYKSPPCNAFGDVLRVIGGSGLSQGPGAAEVGPGSMIAVWQASRITLRSTLINVSGTGLVTAEPGVVMPGAVTALGDVTAVTVSSGVVKAFAMGGNPARLKQWIYTGGAWTGPVDQLWTDGTAIVPNAGIGATMGFQDSGASARLYAAIPTTSGIEFARQETSGGNAGRWTKLATWASEAQPITLGRPGLAYQHRAGKPNNHGRFYLAVNPAPSAACAQCPAMLYITEGNLTSGATRRLQWLKPYYLGYSVRSGGIALFNDLTRDTNLRAALNQAADDDGDGVLDKLAWFLPVADGIYGTNVKDNDDFAYLKGALRASLGLDGGTWPQGVLPATLP